MKTISYSLADGIATITFDEPNSPVNTMCLQWQEDMDAVAARVLQDKDSITGILLASAKSTFFAGADLKAAMRLTPADAPRIFEEIERVKRNFRTIETLGKPVVSLLNGTALGGGWEVALVGHYRIAIDDRKTQFGLPEVTLGLPPAQIAPFVWQRLGDRAARQCLLSGQHFSAAEAHRLGLVHEVVDADALDAQVAALTEAMNETTKAIEALEIRTEFHGAEILALKRRSFWTWLTGR